jgi:hypothetical protein
MPFAMGEEQDHLEDLFGVKKGKLRSNTKLADHIALYTKRSLSYESDVLNAMRGIFASFARGTRPVWQFWGVPITIPGPFDESRIAKISPQDRGDDPSQILAHNFTWFPLHRQRIERRRGFPSWSWAGWITAIKWAHPLRYKNYGFASGSVPISISVIKQYGDSVLLTEDLVDQILQNAHDEASKYTYRLRIEAEVLQVQLKHVKISHPEEFYQEFSGTIDYIARLSTQVDQTEHLWPFYPTSQAEESESLHRAQCEGTFDCIVVSRHHGLIVRESNGTFERFGLVELVGRRKGTGSKWYFKVHDGPHLRDIFPGSTRTIVLG